MVHLVCTKSHLQGKPTHRHFCKRLTLYLASPTPFFNTYCFLKKHLWMISKHCPYTGTFFPRQEKLVYQVSLSFSRGNYLELQNNGSLFSLMLLPWAGDSEARPQSGLGSPSRKLPEAGPSMKPGPDGHLREVTTPSGLWQLSPTFPSGSLSERICSMCGQESHWIFDHRKVS